MALPNEHLLSLSHEFLNVFEAISGQHPGFRPMHARGVLLTGTFTPTPEAAHLSRAQHLSQRVTPITVRFSNFSGIPTTPDNDPDADPRGCAVRFHLTNTKSTDLVSHSTPLFPAGNASDFMAMLRAIVASQSVTGPNSPLAQHMRMHASVRAFMERPKPTPSSFARETYYGVTAFCFQNKRQTCRFGRYRIAPEEGNDFLPDAVAQAQPPFFLFDEIRARVHRQPVRFRLVVQVADEDDPINDSTIQWPDDRLLLDLGRLELTSLSANDNGQQQQLIFDPLPRLDGIEPTDDPLLMLRSIMYQLSGQRRRAAGPTVMPSDKQ